MDRMAARRLMDEVCGALDRARWSTRLDLRRWIESPGFSPTAGRRRLAEWIRREVSGVETTPELAAQVDKWLGRLDTPPPTDNGRLRHAADVAPPGDATGERPGSAGALEREIATAPTMAHWSRRARRAQLAAWAGRLRALYASGTIDWKRQRQIHRQLLDLSRTWRPGHIDAFRADFDPGDWEQYIEAQMRELHEALAEQAASEAGVEWVAEADDPPESRAAADDQAARRFM